MTAERGREYEYKNRKEIYDSVVRAVEFVALKHLRRYPINNETIAHIEDNLTSLNNLRVFNECHIYTACGIKFGTVDVLPNGFVVISEPFIRVWFGYPAHLKLSDYVNQMKGENDVLLPSSPFVFGMVDGKYQRFVLDVEVTQIKMQELSEENSHVDAQVFNVQPNDLLDAEIEKEVAFLTKPNLQRTRMREFFSYDMEGIINNGN